MNKPPSKLKLRLGFLNPLYEKNMFGKKNMVFDV